MRRPLVKPSYPVVPMPEMTPLVIEICIATHGIAVSPHRLAHVGKIVREVEMVKVIEELRVFVREFDDGEVDAGSRGDDLRVQFVRRAIGLDEDARRIRDDVVVRDDAFAIDHDAAA